MAMKDSGFTPKLDVDPKQDDAARANAAEAELRKLREHVARVEAENEDQPIYEVAGPNSFFSADQVLYPPGSVIKDPYGTMGLNPELIPLNPPAEERIDQYLSSLPGQGAPSRRRRVKSWDRNGRSERSGSQMIFRSWAE
jgi:hypothetical protein